MNKSRLIRGMAAVALFALAPGAAAKTIGVLLYSGSFSQGTTFTDCTNSSSIWAETSGYDVNGARTCFARTFSNNLWLTQSGANVCSNATKQAVELRSTGTVICSSPQSAWGTGQFCSKTNLWHKPSGGSCGFYSPMYAFSDTQP